MAKSKFEPLRFCVACRKKFNKNIMLRVARISDGTIDFDLTQKLPGRGVYVCCNENCFKILKKRHGLEKGLKCAVSEEIYLVLEKTIKGRENL